MLKLYISLFTFISGVAITTFWVTQRSKPTSIEKIVGSANTKALDKSFLSPGDITFLYPKGLFNTTHSELVPDKPLEDPTHKPDYVSPRHIRFTFEGPYIDGLGDTYFTPELCVYPVNGFKEVYSIDPASVQGVEEDIGRVKALIAGKTTDREGEFPHLPYIEGADEFRVHVKKIDFEGGKGVAYVTQFNIERSLVSNRMLTYVYQGLTDDNQYYVWATFPVKVKMLEGQGEMISNDGYSLPMYFSLGAEADQKKLYQAYINGVVRRLEKLPGNRFNPSLDELERMIRSLRIRKTI